MARRNTRTGRGQHGAIAARWAGRRSRAVVTIRARRRDLARIRDESARTNQVSRSDDSRASVCTMCAGTGQVAGEVCVACRGSGSIPEGGLGPV
jgi:hypothetical protein